MFVDILNQPDFSSYDFTSIRGGEVLSKAARLGEGPFPRPRGSRVFIEEVGKTL
jgi:hypothetical protein